MRRQRWMNDGERFVAIDPPPPPDYKLDPPEDEEEEVEPDPGDSPCVRCRHKGRACDDCPL